MRLLKILAIILIAIVAAAYAVSYFYDKYGSFTVKISKYDMINQGLTLSETPGLYHEQFKAQCGYPL